MSVLSRVPALLALAIAACAPDPLDRSLADVDLADMETVQVIARGLSAEDRGAFSTYVALHAPTGPGFCGVRLVDDEGRDPQTVGEAIALTRARTIADEAQRRAELAPKTDAQLAHERRAFLTGQIEVLIARRSALYSQHGPAAERLPEWSVIARDMAAYERQIASLPAGAAKAS